MGQVKLDVVGLNWHLSDNELINLEKKTKRKSQKVELRREKKNPHDSNAIMVILATGEIHIGYISRQVAKVLAPAFDKGTTTVAKAYLFQVNSKYGWGRIRVSLKTPAVKPKIHA